LLDPSTNTVSNYDFIVAQYKEKIENTRALFKNDRPLVLINFMWKPEMTQVVKENMDEMMHVLTTKYMRKKFYLFLFTNGEMIIFPKHIYVVVIPLRHCINDWHTKTKEENFALYEEIYTKFHIQLRRFRLDSGYPLFQHTEYYKEVAPLLQG
jgi:hypothetical protein